MESKRKHEKAGIGMSSVKQDGEKQRKNVLSLVFVVAGTFLLLVCVYLFNRLVFPGLPLGVRAPLAFLLKWIMAVPAVSMMLTEKNKLSDYGFTKERISLQLTLGAVIGLTMSLLFTVLPILLGLRDWVGEPQYSKAWQFIYDFLYCMLAVSLSEELVFRGHIFYTLLNIRDSKWLAIIISSILFGLFHILDGGLLQMAATALLGVLFCLCREKLKSCTTLSIIVAHGLYDALIALCVYVL
jgi:membrane protease YdiL (CAAX protease family)